MTRHLLFAAGLTVALGLGAAQAASTAAAPSSAGGAQDRTSISKQCSAQADAQGLHGKARKKFRSECKHRGGKPS